MVLFPRATARGPVEAPRLRGIIGGSNFRFRARPRAAPLKHHFHRRRYKKALQKNVYLRVGQM